MIFLGAALIALGIADLVRSLSRPSDGSQDRAPQGWTKQLAPSLVGGLSGAALLYMSGHSIGQCVAFFVVVFVALVVWGGLTSSNGSDKQRQGLRSLAFMAGSIGLLVAVSPWLPEPDRESAIANWLDDSPFEITSELSASELVLLLGVLTSQLATGNVLVRSLLGATGVAIQGPQTRLRGGRVIGPIERLLIIGFVIGGEASGAALIVAAKSLLRFPEVSQASKENGVAELSEYFLVGSLASWLIALAPIVLLSGLF